MVWLERERAERRAALNAEAAALVRSRPSAICRSNAKHCAAILLRNSMAPPPPPPPPSMEKPPGGGGGGGGLAEPLQKNLGCKAYLFIYYPLRLGRGPLVFWRPV